MLNAYYRIEGAEKKEPQTTGRDDDLDQQGFDAKRYFDAMVASGQLPDLVKRHSELETAVKSLDADMQMLVYENYSKFIRATDVIKQMKFTIDGIEPDLKCLEGNLSRINVHQKKAEDGVSGRAQQIEGLLKQQRVCRKLQVLFSLPETLQRCLDRGAYGKAVEAYCACSGFLRQYKGKPTFQKVLEEVEHQMGRIRDALQQRLRSPDLPVEEAVNSSVTLLDLGEDHAKVVSEYLSGRTAMLQGALERCFATDRERLDAESVGALSGEGGAVSSKDKRDLQRPESLALSGACARITELYVPYLCDAVEGFQKLQDRIPAPGTAAGAGAAPAGGAKQTGEDALSEFVSARVEALCDRLSELVGQGCPPTRVLVSCVHQVRDALRRLYKSLPRHRLLTKLFMGFLERTANDAMRALFTDSACSLVRDLRGLHGECKRLQESKNSGLDDVLEQIAKTEESMMMYCFSALTECQPLLSLLNSDRAACQQLIRGLHSQLITLFLSFVEACHLYIGSDSDAAKVADPSLPVMPRVAAAELDQVIGLDWNGLFGLALVRIGRHLEVKGINKAWAVAADFFGTGGSPDGSAGSASAPELVPNSAVIRATRAGAQAVITYYALASGQRVAHFFRNSITNRNWMTVREPRDPRPVVEIVLKEVFAFDAQLARILGDPRRQRPADVQRRLLSRSEDAAEMRHVERMLAKRQQVFGPIPFNRNGAIVGILRIAFKALYEYMREETFAKFGLQQIQVDCAFLAEVARDFVEEKDAAELDGLLDEVVTSASQRCVEPVLMDLVIVETLCDEKKKTFKFE